MNNVVKYYTRNVDLVPVTTSDKSFLRNTLGPIIDSSDPYIEEKRRSGQYTYLAALVQRAQATGGVFSMRDEFASEWASSHSRQRSGQRPMLRI